MPQFGTRWAWGRGTRERSLIVNDNPVERSLLDQTEHGFGYEPALALLDETARLLGFLHRGDNALVFDQRPRQVAHQGQAMAGVAPELAASVYAESDTGLMTVFEHLSCAVANRVNGGLSNHSKPYQAMLIRECVEPNLSIRLSVER